jgi:hypothetical protein
MRGASSRRAGNGKLFRARTRQARIRDAPVTLAQLRQLLDVVGARPLSADYPVWELARPWMPLPRRARRFQEAQSRILDAIRALPWSPYLRIPEKPRRHGLGGSWQLAARETWVVPTDEYSPEILAKFLCLGDWTLYLSVDPVPATSLPHCFQSSPRELFDFVESYGVPVLVEAFHENNPWRLVIEPAAVPGVVAA